MTQLSGYCTNCGSEIEGGASFCTKCGASTSQTLQNDVEEKSSEGGRDYRRYLAVDKTGGFLGIAAPIFVWSTAAGVLMWSVIGLISLRFDIGLSYLSDRFEIPFVGVTRETIVRRLVGAGVPTELAQWVEDILASGEAARYTPEPPSSSFSRDHLERTANLLVELDGAIQA